MRGAGMDFAHNLHLLAVGVLVGVVWLVQLILYPSFQDIHESHFLAHHKRHTQKITYVVAPAMLTEIATGVWIWRLEPNFFWTLQLVLIAINFGLTFVFAVPIHAKLESGKNPAVIHKLLRINLLRSICWTSRLASLLLMSVVNEL